LTGKRQQIEEKLGQPLKAYLRDRLLSNITVRQVARELGLDPATIRYYIKKWELPYLPEPVREKRRKDAKLKKKHLDLCICRMCTARSCKGARESHRSGRCVVWCRSFKGRHGDL